MRSLSMVATLLWGFPGIRKPAKKIPFILQEPPKDLDPWLDSFSSWSHAQRLCAIDLLIGRCHPTQVRHMMAVIEPQFQRDFISLLPKGEENCPI